jgi:hypothetical protein
MLQQFKIANAYHRSIGVTRVAVLCRLAEHRTGIKEVSIARKPTTGGGVGRFDSCRGHQKILTGSLPAHEVLP